MFNIKRINQIAAITLALAFAGGSAAEDVWNPVTAMSNDEIYNSIADQAVGNIIVGEQGIELIGNTPQRLPDTAVGYTWTAQGIAIHNQFADLASSGVPVTFREAVDTDGRPIQIYEVASPDSSSVGSVVVYQFKAGRPLLVLATSTGELSANGSGVSPNFVASQNSSYNSQGTLNQVAFIQGSGSDVPTSLRSLQMGGLVGSGSMQFYSSGSSGGPLSLAGVLGMSFDSSSLTSLVGGALKISFADSANPSRNFSRDISLLELGRFQDDMKNATTPAAQTKVLQNLLGPDITAQVPDLASGLVGILNDTMVGGAKSNDFNVNGANSSTTYIVDGSGQLNGIVTTTTNGSLVNTIASAFDAAGNPEQTTTTSSGGGNGVSSALLTTITYAQNSKPSFSEWAKSVVEKYNLYAQGEFADMSGFGQSWGMSRFAPVNPVNSSTDLNVEALEYVLNQAATNPSYKQAAVNNAAAAMMATPEAQFIYENYGAIPLDQLFQPDAPKPYLSQGHGGSRPNPDAPALLNPELSSTIDPSILIHSGLNNSQAVAFDPSYGLVTYPENTYSENTGTFNKLVMVASAVILSDLGGH